jgi:hypothetical protein
MNWKQKRGCYEGRREEILLSLLLCERRGPTEDSTTNKEKCDEWRVTVLYRWDHWDATQGEAGDRGMDREGEMGAEERGKNRTVTERETRETRTREK